MKSISTDLEAEDMEELGLTLGIILKNPADANVNYRHLFMRKRVFLREEDFSDRDNFNSEIKALLNLLNWNNFSGSRPLRTSPTDGSFRTIFCEGMNIFNSMSDHRAMPPMHSIPL